MSLFPRKAPLVIESRVVLPTVVCKTIVFNCGVADERFDSFTTHLIPISSDLALAVLVVHAPVLVTSVGHDSGNGGDQGHTVKCRGRGQPSIPFAVAAVAEPSGFSHEVCLATELTGRMRPINLC